MNLALAISRPNDHKSPINMKVREQVVVEGCGSEPALPAGRQQKKFTECINY